PNSREPGSLAPGSPPFPAPQPSQSSAPRRHPHERPAEQLEPNDARINHDKPKSPTSCGYPRCVGEAGVIVNYPGYAFVLRFAAAKTSLLRRLGQTALVQTRGGRSLY